jgi:type IV secretion system protein VirB4
VVGPTGAGKSVLLAMLALQFRRYQHSQIILFDKGRSARSATLAVGGAWYELGVEGGLAFQPLGAIDDDGGRLWALDWLCGVLAHEVRAVRSAIPLGKIFRRRRRFRATAAL